MCYPKKNITEYNTIKKIYITTTKIFNTYYVEVIYEGIWKINILPMISRCIMKHRSECDHALNVKPVVKIYKYVSIHH